MNKCKLLFSFLFLSFLFHSVTHAQTLTYEVDGDNLYSDECGDCSGGPDYVFNLRVNDPVNSAWSNWNYSIEDSGVCEWIGQSNFNWRDNTSGDNSTIITVQLDAVEEDNFLCGGNDGECGGFGTVGTNLLCDLPPCTFHYFEAFRTCDGIDWGVYYSYRYTYDDLFPGAVTAADQASCAFDPAAIQNVTSATKWATYQWEMSTDGTTWTDVAGATAASYDPPFLNQTTSYRRRVDDCSNRTAYSNEVTYDILPISTAYTTLDFPASTTFCGPQQFVILIVSGGNPGTNSDAIWYSDAALTNQVGTGSTWQTPPLSADQTYYVVRSGDCGVSAPYIVTLTFLPDTDGDGICDANDTDADNDGVANANDTDPLDPNVCQDLDGDGCDDCSVGVDGFGPLADNDVANDGADYNNDGICDLTDPPCPDHRVISDTHPAGTNEIIEADLTITSTEIVENGAIIDYHAGDFIDMLAGFDVEVGADFHAYILGCTTPAPLIGDGSNNTMPIYFNLDKAETITIILYDTSGNIITTRIVDQQYEAGQHLFNLDISDLSSGVYYYHVIGEKTTKQKMVVNK